MSQSLGTASLILSTDSKPLSAGLGKASKDTQSWASRQRASMGSGLKSGLGAAVKGGIAGLAAGATVAATQFGADSVTGFVSAAKDRFAEISKVGDFAKTNNIKVEDATGMFGLARNAGSDYKDFVEGLIAVQDRVNESLAGTGTISQEAFSKLGVSAQSFQGLNSADQFYKLFGAINDVGDGATKTSLVLKFFGEDTGKNLLGLLGKTEPELRKMGAGFAFSTEEMAKAQVASAALSAAQAAMSRAFDTLLIALSPVFTLIGDMGVSSFNSLGTSMNSFGNQVIPVLKSVTMTIAAMIDVMKFAGGAWDIAQGGIVKGIGAMMDPKLFNPHAGGKRNEMGDILDAQGQEQINQGHAALRSAWQGDTGNAAERIFTKFENSLKMKIDTNVKALTPGVGQVAPAIAAPKKPLDAVVQGSKESASAIAGFKNEGVKQADVAKLQLKQQEKTNALLDMIYQGQGTSNGVSLKVI